MKKKSTAIVSLVSILSISVVGCAAPASTSSGKSGKSNSVVTLTVGDWPTKTASNYALMNKEKAAFEKANPDIIIKPSTMSWWTGTGAAPFYTAAAAGQLPNLNPVPFTEPQKIMDAGYALPITQELRQSGWLKYLKPSIVNLFSRNGQIYGIPNYAYVLGMAYNAQLFKKAGLVDKDGIPILPKTWNQLAQDAVQIKKKTGQIGFLYPLSQGWGGWVFLNIARSYGAQFEVKKNGKWVAGFNSPQGVKALQFLKDLRWKYNVLEPNLLSGLSDENQLFGTGQVGMMINVGASVSTMIQQYHFSLKNFAEGAMPAGPDGTSALSGGGFYMLSAQSTPAQANAALKWLSFIGDGPLMTKSGLQGFESGVLNDVKTGQPVGPGLLSPEAQVFTSNAPIVKKENQFVAKHTNVNMALYNSYANFNIKLSEPEPPIQAQELYATLENAIQEVLTNRNASPKEALDQAAENFQKNVLDSQNSQN